MNFFLVYSLFSKNSVDTQSSSCYKVCNMKTISTLRELFINCNLTEVYTRLNYRHSSSEEIQSKKQKRSFSDCASAYKNVIIQMMLKPIKKASMPLYVSYEKDSFGENTDMYYSVCYYNNKYQTPPNGKKPWHGAKHSEEYYNANLNKYNKLFGIIGNDWSSLVNADVIVDKSAINASNEELVTEILWEITFYSFSEKESDKFVNNLNKRIKSVKKSVSKKKK